MFTLPSMWNPVISTIVFFITASILAWGTGAIVDWAREKIGGPPPVTQTSDDLLRLMKEVKQARP